MKQRSGRVRPVWMIVVLLSVIAGCVPSGTGDGPVIVDEDGAELSSDQMAARLAEGGWVAEPQADDAGEVYQILVRREDSHADSMPPGFEPPAGAIMIDESTPMMDEDGNPIDQEEFFARMESGEWMPEPMLDEEGNVEKIVLRRVEEGSAPPIGSAEMVGGSGDRFLSQPFPDFEFTTLAGDRVSRDDLRGKISVVNFWFRACKPCMMEVPELNELVAEYADDGVVFLAFTWDDEADAREAVSESSFAYDVVAESMSLHEEMKVNSYPTHLIFGRDGACVAAFQGYTTGMGETIAAEIEKLLD